MNRPAQPVFLAIYEYTTTQTRLVDVKCDGFSWAADALVCPNPGSPPRPFSDKFGSLNSTVSYIGS